jgi:hypothetical protein
MKAGAYHLSGDRVIDCQRRANIVISCDFDPYDVGRKAYESYAASAMFFGENSEYIAVRFQLRIDIVETNKNSATAEGLVILKTMATQ